MAKVASVGSLNVRETLFYTKNIFLASKITYEVFILARANRIRRGSNGNFKKSLTKFDFKS